MAVVASQPQSGRQPRVPFTRDNNRGVRKVAKLLANPKEDLTLLSDRQMSVLLSTFGNGCESVSSLRRAAFMSQALQALRERGVVLGPLTRNAILSARIDNAEQVSVVEELKDWEAAGLSPDAETYGYLSKVYANSANTQAIVDIINHMKTNGFAVSETVLESLIYSLAKAGHYKQAEAFVQKFVASANEVVLRTAIARAAVSRGDFSVVFNNIAAIPSGAKPNQISNNKYILEVLIDMLEAGEMDAVEKLTNSKLKKEERIKLLADLATVLFSYDSERTPLDVMAMYPVIYVLGGKDVHLAIPALESLQSAHVRKEYATALVQQLLRKGDPLSEEKLEKLLNSGAVQSLSVSRLQKQIASLVMNREKKEGAADERQLALAARLLALNFPRFTLQKRVRISPEDITASKKLLIEKGQKEKAELLEMLRKKSQTYTRWLESSLEDLEEEMAHICGNPDPKPAVVNAIHEVILKKIISETPVNYAHVGHHLQQIKESDTKPSSRVSDLANQMFSAAFSAALVERNFGIMEKLWENRGKLEEALQLMVEHTVESNSALGQYQLAAAAVRAENMVILKSVFDVVKRAHGKEVAFLDLAMVLLEEGKTERALKLLEVVAFRLLLSNVYTDDS
ncbi:hypothetical protein TELCIR_07979 [Teladorsagia circumcincta]|uniref:Pentacotripeptide-repeat region of PRORP domain-containing protein n=1 Tax=Teladorsagia circumcincta TaxID=45464 RepID=A0A2G9UIV9_TELCI|nr:hypothetical protein TELCIR_07979 [Teladorsagia circumcincta]